MRDERIFLGDMLEPARAAESYVAGLTHEEFVLAQMVQDAVCWRLAIIGEGAKKISAATRARMPTVPFDDIARMRDRLAHVYWRIDHRIVWATVKNDLGPLIKAIAEYLAPPRP